MKTKTFLLRAMAVFSTLAGGAAFAEVVKPEVQYLLADGRWAIRLSFLRKADESAKEKVALRVLDPSQGAAFAAESYELKDGAGNRIPVKPRPANVPGLLSWVLLDLAGPLAVENHTLVVKGGQLHVVSNGKTNGLEEANLTLPKERIGGSKRFFERDQAALRENSIELGGGSPGGVAMIRLSVQKDNFAGLDWAHLRLNGSADLTIDADDRREFFNNVSGELNVFAPLFLGAESANPRYSELAVHAKTESDQEFRTTDGLVGARFGIYPKDPLTRWLGTLFVRTNNHVGPLIFVGYDFARNLGGHPETNAAASGINTERADHRVSALLRWRIPILDNFDFSSVAALEGRYDVDVDLELKGVYDINAERFLDQSRLSLQFTRINDRIKPALVFTWARGKEGPTWHDVNTLLAGLKVSF